MGALAAVLCRSRKKINAVSETIKMLEVLKHRGREAHGVSTDKISLIVKDIGELKNLVDIESNIALGYNFSSILPEDSPQPLEFRKFKLIFEGKIFSPNHMGAKDVISLLEQTPKIEEFARNVIGKTSGSFSFIIIEGEKLIAGRDPMGTKPLYFCEDNRFFALASERKALWALHMSNNDIKPFPPGNLVEVTKDSVMFKSIRILERPKVERIDESTALERLYNIVLRSFKEKIHGLEKISISFSGGLDSSILAALAKESGIKTLLISVGLEGSRELDLAEKAAQHIGLPYKVEAYTLKDVEAILPKVLWLIEENNAMKASIFLPIYWAAEVSSKSNSKVMLSGQGSDELFAGYHKYLREFKISTEKVESSLYNDILKLPENTLEPEEKVCSFHGIDVRFPYIDYDLATFALSLPITLKIESHNDPLRKRVLRKLAEHIGLPTDICLRPKKAIQYGTGVSCALKKIARKRGMSMQAFINEVFSEIRWLNGNGDNIFA